MTEARGLGPRLRAERERQGLGVQKVADELRLDAWIIEALETGEFGRVGVPVYAKGHLRRYAALLGLPDGDLTEAIDALDAADAAATPPLAETAVRMAASPRLAARLPWRQAALVAAPLALIAGVLWWKPWQLQVRSPAKPVPAPPAAMPARRAATPALPATRASAAAVAPALPATRASAAAVAPAPAATRAAAAPAAGGALLLLDFSADSWVAVRDAAGRQVFSGTGHAGRSLRLAGQPPFAVVLGYGAGVKVGIDGRTLALEPRFIRGNVARFAVEADGRLSPYRAAARPPR